MWSSAACCVPDQSCVKLSTTWETELSISLPDMSSAHGVNVTGIGTAVTILLR